MKKKAICAAVGSVGAAIFAGVCGCSSLPPDVVPLVNSADELSAAVEEYGTGSMSAPVLTPPSATFNFKLTGVNATTFYNDAQKNIQSRVADFTQVANITGLGLSATFVPGAKTSTQPVTPVTASSSPSAPSAADAAALNNGTIGSLLNAQATGTILSDREALFQAAGDTATAAMFQVLGDQTLVAKFADKKVLLGVVTVAVNPGWRTRRGFAADISTQTGYSFVRARLEVVNNFIADAKVDLGIRKRVAMTYGIQIPFGIGDPYDIRRPVPAEYAVPSDNRLKEMCPQVTAIAPMTQSTVNQDQNSRRSQSQVALDLAGALTKAGLTAQGTFFDHFAKSLAQDADAIELSTTVNTYTVNGGLFGFEVGPRLRPIANPNRTSSAPADILERQSFPALILFGFDADDIRPRVQMDEFDQLRVYEPRIKLTTFTNWQPLHNPANGTYRRMSAQERLNRFQRFVDAKKKVDEAEIAEDAANASEDVEQFLEELSLMSPELRATKAQNKKSTVEGLTLAYNTAEYIYPVGGAGISSDIPRLAMGAGSDPSAPARATDSMSRLAGLNNALQAKIISLRGSESEKPLYHQLLTYRRIVTDQIALTGLPQTSRDTAIRYLLDAAVTQCAMLQDTVTKSLPSPPKVDPAAKTNGSNMGGAAGTAPEASKGVPNGVAIKDKAAAAQEAISDLRATLQACVDRMRNVPPPCSKGEIACPDFDLIRCKLAQAANAVLKLNAEIDQPSLKNLVPPDPGPKAAKPPSCFDELCEALVNSLSPSQTPTPKAPSCLEELCQALVNSLSPPSSTPKPPTAPKPADQRPNEVKALSQIGEDIQAATELWQSARDLNAKSQYRHENLVLGASSVQAALFPTENDTVKHTSFSILGLPVAGKPPAKGERPTYNNSEGYAYGYSRELLFKAFGAIYDAPLPATLIEAAPGKHPSIAQVFTDFIPTWSKPYPLATDTVTVTMVGKDLDAVDPSTLPRALEINPFGTNPATADPVAILGFPSPPTPTLLSVQITINPTYKLPLALQFALSGGTDVLNSLPFGVARLDGIDLAKGTIIRRVTGSVTDPSQQTKDELEIIGTSVTPDVLKAKVEENKPETRKRVDVNVDLFHPPPRNP